MTFSRHTPPLWSPRGGGGAELPPGLKLTEDTTSHKEGWLGTERLAGYTYIHTVIDRFERST